MYFSVKSQTGNKEVDGPCGIRAHLSPLCSVLSIVCLQNPYGGTPPSFKALKGKEEAAGEREGHVGWTCRMVPSCNVTSSSCFIRRTWMNRLPQHEAGPFALFPVYDISTEIYSRTHVAVNYQILENPCGFDTFGLKILSSSGACATGGGWVRRFGYNKLLAVQFSRVRSYTSGKATIRNFCRLCIGFADLRGRKLTCDLQVRILSVVPELHETYVLSLPTEKARVSGYSAF